MQPAWHTFPTDDPFYIAPIGDVQWNGHEEDVILDDLKRHVDEALEKQAWFLGMGDYIDMASPTGRQKIAGSGVYENLMRSIDDQALELTHQIGDILKPTRGRWLGMLTGHHYWKDQNGVTSDQRLCEILAAPYLGDDIGEMGGAAIQIPVPTPQDNRAIKLWAHHGFGTGEESAMLLKLKRIAADWEQVDCFFMGHMTKMVSTIIPKLHFTLHKRGDAISFKILERRVGLVGTGGWSKAYIPGRTTYVERKGMRPVALGAPIVKITPQFSRTHTKDDTARRWLPRIEVTLA